MDNKNLIAAIAMSSAIIVLWSLFFLEPKQTEQNLKAKNEITQNTDTPSLDQKEKLVQISRIDAIKENKRVQFENQSIVGSISLKGAVIDDLTFKNYNVSLGSNKNMCF